MPGQAGWPGERSDAHPRPGRRRRKAGRLAQSLHQAGPCMRPFDRVVQTTDQPRDVLDSAELAGAPSWKGRTCATFAPSSVAARSSSSPCALSLSVSTSAMYLPRSQGCGFPERLALQHASVGQQQGCVGGSEVPTGSRPVGGAGRHRQRWVHETAVSAVPSA